MQYQTNININNYTFCEKNNHKNILVVLHAKDNLNLDNLYKDI